VFPKEPALPPRPGRRAIGRPAEPIAADIRSGADGWRLAKLKLIAGLTGCALPTWSSAKPAPDPADGGHHRRSLIGMVITGGLAFYANERRIEANEQRVIAQREAAAARAASDYLVGTFELSDPATENPRTITALTILAAAPSAPGSNWPISRRSRFG